MLSKTICDKVIKACGTPAFVFDADEVRKRAGAIKDIIGDKVGLCYSIKANPFLIPALVDIVDAFEVCSPGELAICMRYDVPAGKIIYSGVHKDAWDVEEAVSYTTQTDPEAEAVHILTAESLGQYRLIRAAAKQAGRSVRVIARLSSKNQFGMSPDDIRTLIRENKSAELVEIAGLHYFAGTQRMKYKHRQEELLMLEGFVKELRSETGEDLPVLEYGPGLPYPYFVDDDRTDTLQPLKELVGDLERVSGISDLTIEMGRFLASSCGSYITSVCDVKSFEDHNWCILDGGINHLNYLGQMMGLKVPVIHRPGEETPIEGDTHYSLCGSLCTTNDVLVRDIATGELKEGDCLIFENTGAYTVTEGMGLFLSRTLPAVVMKEGDDIRIERDAMYTWHINCR